MQEIDFIVDMIEERLAKGGFQWLANFKEIRHDFQIGDIIFPVYAFGGLEERGFLLSKVFSALVTPKYKIHLLLYASDNIDKKLLRNLIISCKSKFGPDDWILLGLIQSKPLERETKETVQNTADTRVGIVLSSLASKDEVVSNNVLGKNLKKQLKLTEARFEAFDTLDYLKALSLIFILGTVFLIALQVFLTIPLTLYSILAMFILSMVAAYPVYKSRYHRVVKLDSKEFEVSKGKSSTQGKWTDYSDVSIYIAPNRELYLRLHSQGKGTFDLPVSRVGISRKDAYDSVKQFLKRK